MTPQLSTIFCSVPSLLVVLAMKALVTPCGVSPILFGHLKYSLLAIFFKIWCMGSRNTMLTTRVAVDLDCPAKSLRAITPYSNNRPRRDFAVSIRPKIPSILWDHLSFPFPLLLVFPNLLILVNAVHELMHIPNRLPCQRFSQIMLGG